MMRSIVSGGSGDVFQAEIAVEPLARLDSHHVPARMRKVASTSCCSIRIVAGDLAEQSRIFGEVAMLIDEGKLRTTLTQRLSPICASAMRDAHARIETGTTVGKIAIEGW